MTKLVKIELKKLFAKKMIYIFMAVVIIITLAVSLLQKYADKITMIFDGAYSKESLKAEIDSYDLNDQFQLERYVQDKSYYERLLLEEKYDEKSPEVGYITAEVYDTIICMNESKYLTKDMGEYEECKSKYDEQINFLNHFDWKVYLNNKKDEVTQEIQQLEFATNVSNVKDDEIEKELLLLKAKKEVLDYRIKHEIPIQFSDASGALDSYYFQYEVYLNLPSEEEVKSYDEKRSLREEIALYKILEYRFKNDMLVGEDERIIEGISTADYTKGVFGNNAFAMLFLILVGGGIIAEEFNKGTIKQLLLKPYSRFKIFASKVIACLVVFVLFLVAYAVVEALINGLVFMEIKSLFKPVLYYDFTTSKVVEQNFFISCIETMLAISPMFLILLGISILMGVLTTNTSTAIIVPIAVNIGADIVNVLATGKLFAYSPTVCWDLTNLLHGGLPVYKGVTFAGAIIVDVITIAILFVLSYLIFKKKDIKNQ